MPGDFNLACQVLFCSTRSASSTVLGCADTGNVLYEMRHAEADSWDTGIIAPKDFDAERVFKATISIHEPSLIDRVLQHSTDPIQVVKTYEDAFAVKEIICPDEGIVNIYHGIKNKDGKTRTIEPVGRVILTPSIIEDGWDNHPTLAEGRRDEGKPISIYHEHSTLANLKEGMKLHLTICQLNIGSGDEGIHFIRSCSAVLPTFHTFLPQSLMMHYKPPRLADRPPPSVEDPDAQDRALSEDVEADIREAENAERRANPELDRQMKEAAQAEALLKVMERVKAEE
jgi:hypothetical protein